MRLTFACGPYDRIEPLRTGAITVPGLDIDVVTISTPRELFDRANLGGEFDSAEMSASEFISGYVRGDRRYVAIPVFPSKVFRHGFITVNAKAGIERPGDLASRRIGLPLYSQTAAIWIRGLLEDEYDVDLSRVTWVQGAVERPGLHGEAEILPLLRPVNVAKNESGRSLEDLLAAGEIQALIGARLPPSLGVDPRIKRLFSDFKEREKDFFRRTRIHPIMHLVVIRRELYEGEQWIASALFEALQKSKAKAWADLCFSGAQRLMLPWIYADIAELGELFGSDPWPYGVEANRPALEALIDYMHRQFFIDRKPRLDELFVDVQDG